jgi:uncharacterized GH25 family protein
MKRPARKSVLGLICFFPLFLSAPAGAHMLWLTPSDAAPAPGETVQVTIGFGHHFPKGKMEKKGRLARIHAVAPDGGDVECEPVSAFAYRFTPRQEGTYWLYAELKPGFISSTPTGRQRGSRKTLDTVVSCSAYRISAMTAVRCGGGNWRAPKGGALDLELMPVSDPANTGKKDELAIKVLFQGRPLAGARITPQAAEGSGSRHHHGSHHHSHDSADILETADDGIARVRPSAGGAWLFTARHKRPYPEPQVCDTYSYSTSLTMDFGE